MTDLIKLYELLKEKIGEETAKLLVDTISKIYSNGYIKNEQFIEVIRKLDEFARREDLDKLSNYIIELSRAIEGRIKSFEDMVKFEFSNIWQELKQLSGKIEEIQKNFATKDDIKELKEEQKNFATKDDIKRLEKRIERLEKMILGFSITIISSILLYFLSRIFLP